MNKTATRHKIGLVLLGIVLFIIMLECFLRVAGFAMIARKEWHTSQLIKHQNDFRILCLGESTTDNQWPPYLANILNDTDQSTHFTIIDKGKTGAHSADIVSHLKSYLNIYKPHMIITMMGINDSSQTVTYQETVRVKFLLFLRSLRTFKLTKLLMAHMRHKIEGINNIYIHQKETILPQDEIYADNEKHMSIISFFRRYYQVKRTEHQLLKTIKEDPQNGAPYLSLGLLYREQSRDKEAERYLQKAATRMPNDVQAHIALGGYYFNKHQYEKALSSLRRAYTLSPENPTAWSLLATTYLRQQNYQHLEELLDKDEVFIRDKNVLNDENFYTLYLKAGLYFKHNGNLAKAEHLLRRAIQSMPHNDTPYMELAWCYYDQERTDEAETQFKKNVALFALHERPYVELAFFYLSKKQYEKASETLEKVSHIAPQSCEVTFAFACLYVLQDKADKAYAMFKQMYERTPNEPMPIFNYAKALIYQNKSDVIEQVIAQFPLMFPDDRPFLQPPSDLVILGDLYMYQGKFEKAELLYREAVQKNPYFDRYAGGVALALLNQGDVDTAATYFNNVKEKRLIKDNYFFPTTLHNYNLLKETIHDYGATLVCVAYPMRSVESLKNILDYDPNIIFVSNEKTFQQAVLAEDYYTYFIDNFGGDFGHCTEKGNVLLAKNIAAVIMKEYFRKDTLIEQ